MERTSPGVKTRSAQAQGAKTLILVAAVAATVGGWVALSTAVPSSVAQTPATVAVASLVPTPLPFGQSPGGRMRRGGLPSGSTQQPAFSNPAPGQFPAPSAHTRSSR